MGESNCGTQGKLSALFTGMAFAILAFKFINSDRNLKAKVLHLLGDCSFGIFFSHLAVMSVLRQIPCYAGYVPWPVNGIVVITFSCICVLAGKKVMGKYGKYLAFR